MFTTAGQAEVLEENAGSWGGITKLAGIFEPVVAQHDHGCGISRSGVPGPRPNGFTPIRWLPK